MKRGLATMWLVAGVGLAPAWADSTIDAKMQCQVEYGGQSDMGVACKEGVDLAQRAAVKSEDAMSACLAGRDNGAQISACQQGVAFHARFAGRVRSSDKSSFSYTWQQPQTGFRVDIGDYQASVGNQKVMEDCMRAFDGSGTPPSCLAGITVQPEAPPPLGGVGER